MIHGSSVDPQIPSKDPTKDPTKDPSKPTRRHITVTKEDEDEGTNKYSQSIKRLIPNTTYVIRIEWTENNVVIERKNYTRDREETGYYDRFGGWHRTRIQMD